MSQRQVEERGLSIQKKTLDAKNMERQLIILHVDRVKMLIDEKFLNVNAQDDRRGNTYPQRLCYNIGRGGKLSDNEMDVFRLYLETPDFNVNSKNIDGSTLIHTAIQDVGDDRILDCILKYAHNLDANIQYGIITNASAGHDHDNNDHDDQDPHNRSPLQCSIQLRHIRPIASKISILLDENNNINIVRRGGQRVNVNIQNWLGETPLYTILKKFSYYETFYESDVKVIKWLIDAKADPNIPRFIEGGTPLHVLAGLSHENMSPYVEQIADYMLMRGLADPINIKVENGLSAVDIAEKKSNNAFLRSVHKWRIRQSVLERTLRVHGSQFSRLSPDIHRHISGFVEASTELRPPP